MQQHLPGGISCNPQVASVNFRRNYAKTGINAIELPGDYFSVYGYYADGDDSGWWPIEIASAEYHHDGYMYMWSKDIEGEKNPFSNYDSVLVSFTNPVLEMYVSHKESVKSFRNRPRSDGFFGARWHF